LGVEFFATDANDLAIQQFSVTDNVISATLPATSTMCISAYGRYGVISNNSLTNCGWVGIEVLAGYTGVIGSTLVNTGPITWDGRNGSHQNLVISGNNMTGSSSPGAIQVIASSVGSNNYDLETAVIGHNTIRGPSGQAGILVQTQLNGAVVNIHIDDNMFDSLGSTQRAIDSEGSPSQVQIENNRFINVSGTGLYLNGGVNFTVRFNYFNGGTWLSNFGTTITRTVENIVNGVCCS